MYKFKKSGVVLLASLAIFTGIATAIAVSQRPPVKPIIALILSTKNNPYFATIEQAAEAKFQNSKYELQVFDSNNDDSQQSRNIRNAIALNVQGVLINVVNSKTGWNSGVSVLHNLNIPVIAIDRGIDAPENAIAQTIASNNFQGAKEIAEWFKTTYTSSNASVFHLAGVDGAQAAIDRGKGFLAGYGKAYFETQIANFDRQEGQTKTGTVLTASASNFKVIFADNDQMALGAINAIKLSGAKSIATIPFDSAAKNYYVLGFDGEKEALELIEKGEMAATVIQQPKIMGEKAAESMFELLANKPIAKTVDAPTVVVSKANVKNFL